MLPLYIVGEQRTCIYRARRLQTGLPEWRRDTGRSSTFQATRRHPWQRSGWCPCVVWFRRRPPSTAVSPRPGKTRSRRPHRRWHVPCQSINQSINRSIDQSINRSINRSINQSINRSIDRSIDQSINQSINQSIDRSINRSIDQSIDQSINQSIDRSIDQSICLTLNK